MLGFRSHTIGTTWRFFRRTGVSAPLAALVLALGACSSDGGTGPDPDPVADATVTLGAQSFNPSTVVLFRDGTVTWNNTSGVTHNITFTGATAPIDIGDHGAGTNARDFPSTGTFNYGCTLHAGMSGRVRVVDP